MNDENIEDLKKVKGLSLEEFLKFNEELKELDSNLRSIESEEERKKYPKNVFYDSYEEYKVELKQILDALIELNSFDF